MRDHPDWFGQSIWPKYGDPIEINETHDIPPDDSVTDLFSGSGILYSLNVHVECIEDISQDLFGIYSGTVPLVYSVVDGIFMHMNATDKSNLLLPLVYWYDKTGCTFSLSREIPFTSDLSLYYKSDITHAADVTVYFNGWYYIVQ